VFARDRLAVHRVRDEDIVAELGQALGPQHVLVVAARDSDAVPVDLVLALALLPVEFVFWIGFALPFGPLLGLARTALVVAVLMSGD